MNALIIEPDEPTKDSIMDYLYEAHGIEMEAVKTMIEGEKILQQRPFDMVFTDSFYFNQTYFIGFLQRIKKIQGTLGRTIVSSAFPKWECELSKEFCSVLIKPFSLADLDSIVLKIHKRSLVEQTIMRGTDLKPKNLIIKRNARLT